MRVFGWLAVTTVAVVAVLVLVFEVPAQKVMGAVLSLACPAFLLMMLLAPGIGYQLSERLQHSWERLKSHRAEIEELSARIDHMGKPHHMAQLAEIYFRQGRYQLAADWLAKALEKEGELLDARYKLAICRMHQRRFQEAVQLLEQVHAAKPDHDYGGAYLCLAQANERAGNLERAAEVYSVMLRFYRGHPEACYRYGLLLERLGDLDGAQHQMQQVVSGMRTAPPFQRRRNRHWMWKAKWWLIRSRKAGAGLT